MQSCELRGVTRIFFITLMVAFCFSIRVIGEDDFWFRDGELENWCIEKIDPAVVFISNESNGKTITGVLLRSKEQDMLLLTNNHFLSDINDKVFVYLVTEQNQIKKYHCEIVKNDSRVDLAVFKVPMPTGLAGAEIQNLNEQLQKGNHVLSNEMYATNKDIPRGKEILFVGFPLSQGVSYQIIDRTIKLNDGEEMKNRILKPIYKNCIVRYGRIASKVDLSGNFLIDAMTNHGNSGSPVFVRTGYRKGSDIISEYKFVGLVSSFISDYIIYKDERGQEIRLPHNSGLGVVISIDTIKIFLKDLQS